MLRQPSKSRNKPPRTVLSHELDGIPLLNILSGSVRQRRLQEVTAAHYGKGNLTGYVHIVKERTVK